MKKKNILLTEQQLWDLLSNFFKGLLGGEEKTDVESQQLNKSDVKNEDFYKKLLQKLGASATDENLKFLFAWRQSEGKAGKFNPFNTTQSMPGSTNFNSVGVKNYKSLDDGLEATYKTLTNGRYNCIVNGLKSNIGAKNISTKCINDLKTWGTGDLIAKVISGYEKGATPNVKDLA